MRRSVQVKGGWAALLADAMGRRPYTPLIASLEEPIPTAVQAAFDAAWEEANPGGRTGSTEARADAGHHPTPTVSSAQTSPANAT